MADAFIGLVNVGLPPEPREEGTAAIQAFGDVAWADTMIFEPFTSLSGLTLSDAALSVDSRVGLVLNAGASSTFTVTSENFSSVMPSGNSGTTVLSFSSNSLATAPTTNNTYTGTYPRDYRIDITTAGGYGAAKCTVTRAVDSTVVVAATTISQDTDITIPSVGTTFKWADAGLTFYENDAWTIKAQTGNIRNLMGTYVIASGTVTSKLEVTLTNDFADTIVPAGLTSDTQYAEETDWTTKKGSSVKWKLSLTGTNAVISSLYVFVGDNSKFDYWDAT